MPYISHIARESHRQRGLGALVRQAYSMMRTMLSQSNFMPFCLTMLALLSRLRALLGR